MGRIEVFAHYFDNQESDIFTLQKMHVIEIILYVFSICQSAPKGLRLQGFTAYPTVSLNGRSPHGL